MVRKYSIRSENSLRGVHADLRRVVDATLQSSPADFIVTQGLRSIAEQRDFVARGLSKTMNSRHLTGHAVDLWPIDPLTGKAVPGGADKRLWELLRVIAATMKREAEALDVKIVWGGDWGWDAPHFELERKAYPA